MFVVARSNVFCYSYIHCIYGDGTHSPERGLSQLHVLYEW